MRKDVSLESVFEPGGHMKGGVKGVICVIEKGRIANGVRPRKTKGKAEWGKEQEMLGKLEKSPIYKGRIVDRILP